MLAPSCQRGVRYILPVLLIYGVLPGPALGWHVAESLLDEDDGARSAASAEIRQQATYPRHANTGACGMMGGRQVHTAAVYFSLIRAQVVSVYFSNDKPRHLLADKYEYAETNCIVHRPKGAIKKQATIDQITIYHFF